MVNTRLFFLLFRVVTKISSCGLNTTSRGGGISNLLVLFFFYFPLKVAGGHVHIVARGNPQPSPLNDSPVISIFLLITNFGLRRKGASTHCLAKSTAWPINTRVKLSGKFDSFSSIL